MSRVLIVGGDSLIGRALTPALREAGHEVFATSYRTPLPEGAIHLDLSDPASLPSADAFDHVVLAAAVVTRAACEADPARAHVINVEAPIALGRPVLARGGHVVFLSTSIVLGGDTPYLKASAPYAPFDAYSTQKAEAEQRLSALPGAREGLAILRLTKVLDASYGVVAEWAEAIGRGAEITPFSDLVTAPTTVPHVTSRIAGLIAGVKTGVHHVSGIEHPYAEVARRLGAELGWPEDLICPVEGRRLNPVAARNPAHASLAADPLMSLEDVICALAEQIRAGQGA